MCAGDVAGGQAALVLSASREPTSGPLCVLGGPLVWLVAEDGRVIAGPLPYRRRTRDLGVQHLFGVSEVASIDADRAEPELAATVRELLKDPLERRATLASDARSLAWKPQADCLLGRPSRPFSLTQRGRRDKKRDEDTLCVLESGREIDECLAIRCPFHDRLLESLIGR